MLLACKNKLATCINDVLERLYVFFFFLCEMMNQSQSKQWFTASLSRVHAVQQNHAKIGNIKP